MLGDRRLSSVAFVIAIGILMGRVTGLLRELALAARFGLTWEADVVMLAISLPDLLNAILIGGAVGAVLIPEFHRLRADVGEMAADQMACQFLVATGLASAAVALIIAVFANVAINILAPGLTGPALANGVLALRVVVIALPFCALAAVISALLQSRERVLSPAFGTLIFNTVIIAAIFSLSRNYGCVWLSGAVIGAAFVRLAVQTAECLRSGLLIHGWGGTLRFGRLTRDFFRRYCQTFGAVGLAVFIPVVARAFASHVEGGIACFNYAYKLVELPQGLFCSVLTMAVFPKISRLVHEHASRCMPLLAFTTSMVVLVTVPVVVFALGAAEPVISLLFQRGNLGHAQVLEIAQLARIAFLALPAMVLITFSTSVFHAFQDTRTPFIISLAIGAALVILCSVLPTQLSGLTAIVTIIQWLNATVLLVALRMCHGIGLGTPQAVARYGLGVIATLALGFMSWSFRLLTDNWLQPLAVGSITSGLTFLVWYLLLRPTLRRDPIREWSRSPTHARSVTPELQRRAA